MYCNYSFRRIVLWAYPPSMMMCYTLAELNSDTWNQVRTNSQLTCKVAFILIIFLSYEIVDYAIRDTTIIYNYSHDLYVLISYGQYYYVHRKWAVSMPIRAHISTLNNKYISKYINISYKHNNTLLATEQFEKWYTLSHILCIPCGFP